MMFSKKMLGGCCVGLALSLFGECFGMQGERDFAEIRCDSSDKRSAEALKTLIEGGWVLMKAPCGSPDERSMEALETLIEEGWVFEKAPWVSRGKCSAEDGWAFVVEGLSGMAVRYGLPPKISAGICEPFSGIKARVYEPPVDCDVYRKMATMIPSRYDLYRLRDKTTADDIKGVNDK